MAIKIRHASGADAEEAISVLRHSITELCLADHRNDPAALGDWLGNKTESAWLNWIAREDAAVLVAERDGRLLGVGMVAFSGEVLLNYVHPAARFTGVSKAMLAEMEATLRAQGVQYSRLESTVTALPFYQHFGYRADAGSVLVLSKRL